MTQLNAAVLGASGYTAAELLRLGLTHPRLKFTALTGNSRAGEAFNDVYPNFTGLIDQRLQDWQDVNWDDIDVVFACLPHGASQDTIAQIAPRVDTVIDLSADFRIKDAAVYEATYGRSHDAPDLLEKAVYGLTEYLRDDLKGASLIACPGCYPTATLLTLLPGIEAGLLKTDNLIIDAKSGVTGAGRKATLGLSYTEITDGAQAYGVGTHRHAPEIDQILTRQSGKDIEVSFTPHLIPMNRGMIVTIYADLAKGASLEELRAAYVSRYAGERFVQLLPEGQVPQTRHVRGSNMAQINVFADRRAGKVILIGVIDNLAKGSSGQALQNLNVAMGWDETLGISGAPVFP